VRTLVYVVDFFFPLFVFPFQHTFLYYVYLSASLSGKYLKGLVPHLPAVRPGATPSDEREWCGRGYSYSSLEEAAVGDVFESAARHSLHLTSGLPKTSRIRYPQLHLRRRCIPQLDLSRSYRLRTFDMSSPGIMMVKRTSSSRGHVVLTTGFGTRPLFTERSDPEPWFYQRTLGRRTTSLFRLFSLNSYARAPYLGRPSQATANPGSTIAFASDVHNHHSDLLVSPHLFLSHQNTLCQRST